MSQTELGQDEADTYLNTRQELLGPNESIIFSTFQLVSKPGIANICPDEGS